MTCIIHLLILSLSKIFTSFYFYISLFLTYLPGYNSNGRTVLHDFFVYLPFLLGCLRAQLHWDPLEMLETTFSESPFVRLAGEVVEVYPERGQRRVISSYFFFSYSFFMLYFFVFFVFFFFLIREGAIFELDLKSDVIAVHWILRSGVVQPVPLREHKIPA